jgi:polyhydroxyalkanoate synthase
MMDFHEAGELGVFIDEEQLSALEDKMNKRGYLEGSEMATTFNMLRANDLIWSFVVNNYLLGNDPFPFDLLYWNAIPPACRRRCTASICARCIRRTCCAKPGGISWTACRSTWARSEVPAYFLSTREDHIAPWKSTYRGTQLLGGRSVSCWRRRGHIAGVVNPPDGGKYSHWINEDLPPDPDEWFKGATEIAGSWWPDWQRWVRARQGAGAGAGARRRAS